MACQQKTVPIKAHLTIGKYVTCVEELATFNQRTLRMGDGLGCIE